MPWRIGRDITILLNIVKATEAVDLEAGEFELELKVSEREDSPRLEALE